jgi:ribonucleoside-diphosphate reductase alpha chain
MCENVANFGHIARRGGGCGVDFSNIRPSGDKVFGSSHYKACGPVNHMIVVSEAMHSITQAGFRAMANMGVLRIDHPDIEKFIKCKQRNSALRYMLKEDFFGHFDKMVDKTSEQANILLDKFISNFNISVMAIHEFMEAVKNDSDFDLKFNGTIYKTVRARDIFNEIVESAWKNGDPGMLFYEAINETSPYRFSGQKISATNPCITGDTIVLTDDGPKKIMDMVNRKHRVLSYHNGEFIWTITKGAFKTQDNAEIISIETNTSKLLCTPDHKILTESGFIEGRNIVPGQMILSNPCGLGVSYGLDNTCGKQWKGLGWQFQELAEEQSRKRTPTEDLVQRWIWPEENSSNDLDYWLDIFAFEEIFHCRGNAAPRSLSSHPENKRDEIRKYVRQQESVLSLAKQPRDGAKNKDVQLRLVSLTDCGESILAEFLRVDNGHVFRFQANKLENRSSGLYSIEWRNLQTRLLHLLQKWEAQEDHRSEELLHTSSAWLQSGYAEADNRCTCRSRVRYIALCPETFEFYQKVSARMEKVVRVSKETKRTAVYDLTTDHPSHNFVANGIVVHNCGEQPLPEYVSCNLGSIDVSKFILNDEIDWKRLGLAVRWATRFLDNVIDTNKFPTQEFADKAQFNRPIGLGIMGFADLLLKLKIEYGSDESIEIALKIMKFFYDQSHTESVQLGKLRGTPPACQFAELDYRRNVTLLTIAPTGSISLLAGCSSSVEPIYSPIIHRSDNTGHYTIPHPDSDKSYFRCAVDKEQNGKREVTWKQHVDMQAAFQKYCCSGVSKTINLPSSATKEDVMQAYLYAYQSGCKGITVYRDGSKTTQVLNTDDRVNYGSSSAPGRPKSLQCHIHKTCAEGMQWNILVGLMHEQPYEIFALNGAHDNLPSAGQIIKRKKRHYSLVDERGDVMIDNLNEAEEEIDHRLGLETRRFSLELRHGIPPKYIVEQIVKSSDKITSFSKAVGRILKRNYLSAEEVIALAEDRYCEHCAKSGKQVEMQPESGCMKCPSCFHARCG